MDHPVRFVRASVFFLKQNIDGRVCISLEVSEMEATHQKGLRDSLGLGEAESGMAVFIARIILCRLNDSPAASQTVGLEPAFLHLQSHPTLYFALLASTHFVS